MVRPDKQDVDLPNRAVGEERSVNGNGSRRTGRRRIYGIGIREEARCEPSFP